MCGASVDVSVNVHMLSGVKVWSDDSYRVGQVIDTVAVHMQFTRIGAMMWSRLLRMFGTPGIYVNMAVLWIL